MCWLHLASEAGGPGGDGAGVRALGDDEFRMGPKLDEATVLHDGNSVHSSGRREAMGNDDHRAALCDTVDRRGESPLRGGVDGGCGLVEYQNIRTDDFGPDQRDELTFAC